MESRQLESVSLSRRERERVEVFLPVRRTTAFGATLDIQNRDLDFAGS